MVTFGENLKKARRVAGLTQEELAYELGCSRDTIRRYETDQSFPRTPYMLQTMCVKLGVSADHLLGLSGSEFSNSANGLQWQDILIPDNSPYNHKLIEHGKIIFKALVRDQMRPEALQKAYPALAAANINQMKQRLRTVLYSGSIRLVRVERNASLEEQLTEAYGLKLCYVADVALPQNALCNIITTEAIGLLAAQEAGSYLDGAQIVALLGGGVLSRWSEFIQFYTTNTSVMTWVAMLSEAGVSSPVGGTANTIVNKIAHYQANANFHLLSYVNPERRDSEYYASARGSDLAELRKARETLLKARAADVAMFSVGSMANWNNTADVPPLRDHLTTLAPSALNRCVGDIMRRFVDIYGEQVGGDRFVQGNNDHVYSLDFDDLRQIASRGFSILVAGRVNKFAVIYAALRQKICNGLVITAALAQKILDMKRIETRFDLTGTGAKARLEGLIREMEDQERIWRDRQVSEQDIAERRQLWIDQRSRQTD